MTTKYSLEFPNISENNDIIPKLSDVIPAFTAPFKLTAQACSDFSFPFPPTNLLPAVPDIGTVAGNYSANMSNILAPVWVAVQMASGVVQGQITAIINFLWGTLTSLFSAIPVIGVMPTMPAWPGFPDHSLPDLMAKDPAPLLANINQPSFDFSVISDLITWDNMVSPAMQAFDALQSSAAGFIALIVDKLKVAINKVTAWIALAGGGSFSLNIPTIPTAAQIEAQLPPNATAEDVYALSIPGFDSFTLPSPLMPNFEFPTFEYAFAISNMIISFVGENVGKMLDFLRTLPTVGAIFQVPVPKIDDMIGTLPTIPSVCHETNPPDGPVCT